MTGDVDIVLMSLVYCVALGDERCAFVEMQETQRSIEYLYVLDSRCLRIGLLGFGQKAVYCSRCSMPYQNEPKKSERSWLVSRTLKAVYERRRRRS